MISFTPTSVSFPIDMAKALLAFASKDKTRPELFGVGVENGDLCAANGHTGVRFYAGSSAPDLVFPRTVVERALKLAAVDKTEVTLNFTNALENVNFPPMSKIDGQPKVMSCTESVFLNPSLFAALTLVAKACNTEEIELVGLTSASNPVFINVQGPEQQALLTGMPRL